MSRGTVICDAHMILGRGHRAASPGAGARGSMCSMGAAVRRGHRGAAVHEDAEPSLGGPPAVERQHRLVVEVVGHRSDGRPPAREEGGGGGPLGKEGVLGDRFGATVDTLWQLVYPLMTFRWPSPDSLPAPIVPTTSMGMKWNIGQIRGCKGKIIARCSRAGGAGGLSLDALRPLRPLGGGERGD